MNLALFFEGTGQGVAGAYTNVTRLRFRPPHPEGPPPPFVLPARAADPRRMMKDAYKTTELGVGE